MARDGIRVTLTLSGGASLGAFQAGTAAALLVAFFHLREEEDLDVLVDALGGASASALVSLMTAHSLLSGADPVKLLSEAWVERVGIETLFQGGSRGPLTFGKVRRTAPELLEAGGDGGPHQDQGLILNISLTGLQGLTYELEGVRDDPVVASSYDDWGEFELQPDGGIEQLVEPSGCSPLDFVLASASHPGAFAPRVLDRSGDRDGYREQGVHSFPESGHLWYTDGGLIQSKPLGRVLSAARRISDADADVHRLDLMIDPRSEEPSAARSGRSRPGGGLGERPQPRARNPPGAGSYDDLRDVERDNSRIRWADDLVEALLPHLDDEGAREESGPWRSGSPPSARRRAASEGDPRDDPGEDAETADLLRRVIGDIGGLTGKNVVFGRCPLAADPGRRKQGKTSPPCSPASCSATSAVSSHRTCDAATSPSVTRRRSPGRSRAWSPAAWRPTPLERTVEALKERSPYEWEDVRGDGRATATSPGGRGSISRASSPVHGRSVIRGSR